MVALTAVISQILWPLIVHGGGVILLVATMLTASYLLGERHQDRATKEVFESGVRITGDARLKFSVRYYLVAVFFVIFDLEVAFIVAWAIAFEQVGWLGYAGAAVFIGILGAVLLYEWRIGALDYGPDGKKILKGYRKRLNKNA